ncbi:EamA family transporter [Cyanobium sp. L1E-Cus]|uniref:EamA family transporter n=1 Tax=Cyanobium sp. L1E-Cus TaxID=2823714 RepID=UPI0020CDD3F7|nr:EamA family transporter [Cyanobium sp. L1E-Cus]MCP9821961.1 EamA family transporter [Cyanobium sp. L1E-Cus]
MSPIPALPLWFIWAFLSALFATASAVFGKIGLESVDADLATLIRTIVIAIFLPLLILATGKLSSPFALSQQTWLFIVISALASGLSSFCFFRALKQGDASLVVPVDRLSLLMVALVGIVFLGERPTVIGWAGLLLVAGGGILFSFA